MDGYVLMNILSWMHWNINIQKSLDISLHFPYLRTITHEMWHSVQWQTINYLSANLTNKLTPWSSLPWGAEKSSASQEVSHTLRNLRVHYRFHKGCPSIAIRRKIMATVFWGHKSALLLDSLDRGDTITAVRYCNKLWVTARGFRSKGPGFLLQGVNILQDNWVFKDNPG